MKRTRYIVAGMVLFCLMALAGCGSSMTTVGNPTSTDDTTLYYDAVKLVAPTFSAASSASVSPSLGKAVVSTWESGNPAYDIFYLFREFNSETDQGVIDTSNLYKTMWESKGYFSDTKSNCDAITEKIIAPPFDFGNTATTYNCAKNTDASNGYDIGGALKELDSDGNIIAISGGVSDPYANSAVVKQGLFGFVWPGDHNEYGVIQGTLDTEGDTLALDIAVWVDYSEGNDYCYRNDIDGNTTTHAFTVRSIKGNTVEGSAFVSIVGKGYSQGDGKYFLLKVSNTSITGKYFCISAGATETELMAMSASGSDTVDANCAEYQTDVDAMTPFTTSNLACATTDFNPGGTGTAAEGTIFLNF